jgi:hypothetical protein
VAQGRHKIAADPRSGNGQNIGGASGWIFGVLGRLAAVQKLPKKTKR